MILLLGEAWKGWLGFAFVVLFIVGLIWERYDYYHPAKKLKYKGVVEHDVEGKHVKITYEVNGEYYPALCSIDPKKNQEKIEGIIKRASRDVFISPNIMRFMPGDDIKETTYKLIRLQLGTNSSLNCLTNEFVVEEFDMEVTDL